MNYVKSYRELEVYKYSRELSKEIYILSKDFPKEERYSMTDQIRRSSRSIGSQIAESWGKRRYVNHFVSKLTDADSEQMETQHWIEISENLKTKCESIGKMIQAMIDKSDSICKVTK